MYLVFMEMTTFRDYKFKQNNFRNMFVCTNFMKENYPTCRFNLRHVWAFLFIFATCCVAHDSWICTISQCGQMMNERKITKSHKKFKYLIFAYQTNRIRLLFILSSTKQPRLSHSPSLTCMIELHRASHCMSQKSSQLWDSIICHFTDMLKFSNKIYISCPNDLCRTGELNQQQISFDEIIHYSQQSSTDEWDFQIRKLSNV